MNPVTFFAGETHDHYKLWLTVDLRGIVFNTPHQTIYHEPVTEYTELSITGTVKGPNRYEGGGQCTEDLDRLLDDIGEGTSPRHADESDLEYLAEVWDRWHLNGMNSCCAHQPGKRWMTDNERKEASKQQYVYVARMGRRLESFGEAWNRAYGDLTCPESGYRIGSAWLVEALPADVIERVTALCEKYQAPKHRIV